VALVAAVTATAVTASTISHYWTKRSEERKLRLLREEALKREAEIKAKTALVRQQTTGEPPGELLDDVTIDKIFLWTVEDLRQHFPGDPTKPRIENTMQCLTVLQKNHKVQPSSHGVTRYNKLITNHECIIGDVVRKPNMPTWSVAYVRAGPRKYLHFDPQHVNACIVTCGGLCPGVCEKGVS
jgi:6-phosphofructokinase 1